MKSLMILILLAVLVCGCVPDSDYSFYDRLYEREPYKSHRRQTLEKMERFLVKQEMQEQSDIIIGKHRGKSNQPDSGLRLFDYER